MSVSELDALRRPRVGVLRDVPDVDHDAVAPNRADSRGEPDQAVGVRHGPEGRERVVLLPGHLVGVGEWRLRVSQRT